MVVLLAVANPTFSSWQSDVGLTTTVPCAKLTGKILFASDINGSNDIFIANADGSARRNLTNSPELDHDAHFSPDGRRIVWSANQGPTEDIYVMGVDGSNLQRLTDATSVKQSVYLLNVKYAPSQTSEPENRQHEPIRNIQPSWSPDGKHIAFLSDSDDQIYVMNANGTNQRRVTSVKDSAGIPQWSPDSKHILFHVHIEHTSQIYTLDLANAKLTQLTKDTNDNEFPVWSPDGKHIAWVANPLNKWNWGLYIMNADGSNQKWVTATAMNIPIWSPDSKFLALNMTDGIYVIGVSESVVVPLVENKPTGTEYSNVLYDWTSK